jgi:cytochrome c peroxidase
VFGLGLVLLTLYHARLDTLANALQRFDRTVATVGPSDSATVRAGFRQVRTAYKRVECLIEYLSPDEAAALNGPGGEGPDEADGENGDPGEPEEESSLGLLQSAERALYRYPVLFVSTRQRLAASIGGARVVVGRLRRSSVDQRRLGDRDVVAAARRELIRVVALGLAGDDSRVAHNGRAEAAAALDGTRDALEIYAPTLEMLAPGSWRALARSFDAAETLLSESADDDFSRLRFIVAVANPLATTLAWLGARPVRADLLAFAPRRPTPASAAQIALGAALFSDPALSGPGTRSCATCHQPARGFTDGLARAAPLSSHPDATLRHTPTLLNVGFADLLFDDGRASSLEQQVGMVVDNPDEMAGSLALAARRLRQRAAVSTQFARAFPAARSSPATLVSPRHIAAALAAYERTLVAFDTPVDRALRGDTGALTRDERHGFNLFMGKAACATCHYLPLFNGMRPPDYAHTDFEVLGVPGDTDSGRARVTHDPVDIGAMKTPGLRFAAPGGPYMHNGAYRSLAEVVDFYDSGGGAGIGARMANQTLSPVRLNLTDQEKHDLIAFLEALRVTAPQRDLATPR